MLVYEGQEEWFRFFLILCYVIYVYLLIGKFSLSINIGEPYISIIECEATSISIPIASKHKY